MPGPLYRGIPTETQAAEEHEYIICKGEKVQCNWESYPYLSSHLAVNSLTAMEMIK